MSLGRDGAAGLVFLAISLGLLFQSLGLTASPLVPVGPGFYPRIVLVGMALASALLVWQDWQSHRRTAPAAAPDNDDATVGTTRAGNAPADAAPARKNYPLVVASFAIVAAYLVLMPLVGFRVSTALFVGTLQATLDRPRTLRGWAVLIVIALLTTVVTYFIFERYLLTLLPRGTWTGF